MSDNKFPKWFVTEVNPRRDYTLHLTFITGERKVYDCRPLLADRLFQPLRNMELFMQAHVQGRSVAWNDEVDIAPEELYENAVAQT